MSESHPDGSRDEPISLPAGLSFDWRWDEVGYHGVDLDSFVEIDYIDTQDAEAILVRMNELREKIQEVILLDVDEASAQTLLNFYNKLARAHRHVKKFAGSHVEEMPYLQGTFATIEQVRRAIEAVRAPRV